MSRTTEQILTSLVGPIIVAVIIGMASSYATARLTLESLAGRVAATEQNIERVEKKAEADAIELKSGLKAAGLRERDLSERLIRLESKIDLLLTRGQ